MKNTFLLIAAVAALALSGCATIDAGGTLHEHPAALKGDYSGKDFSGTYAIIRAPGDIPGIPQSKGKAARWSKDEADQVLYLDGSCQEQLFKQLPGWAQAIVKRSGWTGLVTAVGEAGFASAFPGADVARYALGGLGYGAVAGINTAQIRQDGSEKSSVSICVLQLIQDTNARYHALEGIYAVPWVGDGHAGLPKVIDSTTAPTLEHVDGVKYRPY